MKEAYIASFPKCGRTWLRLILGTYLNDYYKLGLSKDECLELKKFNEYHPNLPSIIVKHDGHPQNKIPAELERDKSHLPSPTILLVRHPGDVIVSWYFAVTKRHPKIVEGQPKLAAETIPYEGTLSDFLREERGSLATYIEYLNIWGENLDRALVIKYEDMVKCAYTEVFRANRTLKIPLNHDILTRAINKCRFDRMQKMETDRTFSADRMRVVDKDDIDTYKVRRGKVNGYFDYLSKDDVEYLQEEIRKLNPIYGYASQTRKK